MSGWATNDIKKLELASKIYPYRRDILLGPAYKALYDKLATKEALENVKLAVKNDPWAVDLLLVDMKIAAALGDEKEAFKIYNKLKQIAPNSVKIITNKMNSNLPTK